MARKKKKKSPQNVVCQNKRTARNYEINVTMEAGLVLEGTEVKSIRAGRVSLQDAYAKIRDGEAFLMGMDIALYDKATHFNHDPRRARKLLLHKREIQKLAVKINERGYTLIPLDLHLKEGRVKVTLALARGKKNYDDRQEILTKTTRREMQQAHDRNR